MIKIKLKPIDELLGNGISETCRTNNIYKSKINMTQLYHYNIPKYGYCFYNFNNIKSELSNGYIIVNLNDILSYKTLSMVLNGNEDNNELQKELSKSEAIALFNTLAKYRQDNYQIIYYVSIYNMLKKYGNTDNEIKKSLTTRCNKIYESINNAVSGLNILISYQYDRFYIRNKYFNEFINSYIKSSVKYLSVNYEVNKFLVGRYYELDLQNIYRYVNNNFLACYKNNLNFISINALLQNNNLIPNSNITTTQPIFTFNINKCDFSKASEHNIQSVNILDINEVSNISGQTTPNRSLNSSFASLNSLMSGARNTYTEELIKMVSDTSDYKTKLNTALNENMNKIAEFFLKTLSDCTGTIIIGANLDYNYDTIIIENLKALILSIDKVGKDKKSVNVDKGPVESKTILDIINSYSNTNVVDVKKINIINVKGDEVSKTLLETINANIVKNAYNILVNIELTKNKFEKIYKYLANNKSCTNIYYDFEINKRLRLSLGINSYYKNFTAVNGISSTGRYNNNRVRYAKLRDFIKYVNNYEIDTSSSVDNNDSNANNNDNNANKQTEKNCCKCCKCRDIYSINYYKVQYLPYLQNIEFLNEIDMDLFL